MFGSDSFTTRECDVVRVMLQKPGFNEGLEIMAHTSPVICSSLPVLVNVNKYTHLQGLDLADNSNLHQSEIDILIGSDYYWQVVTGDIVNGNSGPVSMNNIFGWLLSGPVSPPCTDNAFHSLAIIRKECTSKSPENDRLIQTLKQFWDNGSVGILMILIESSQSSSFWKFSLMEQGMKSGYHGRRTILVVTSQTTFTYALIVWSISNRGFWRPLMFCKNTIRSLRSSWTKE